MSNKLEESEYSELLQQSESKTSLNEKSESFEIFDANLSLNSKDYFINVRNFQIVGILMGEMLDTIESENSECDSITQEIENMQEREKLEFSPILNLFPHWYL